MASITGTATFSSGTGAKSVNIGMLATWVEFEFGGSTIRHSIGKVYGGNQVCYPDDTSSAISGNAIEVKDNSGTVILRGTFTSFTGTHVNCNLTVQTGTVPQMLITAGN